MIRLPSLEPAWHDLPGGLRILARPLTAVAWSLIQTHVRAAVTEYAEQHAAGTGPFDPANDSHRAALAELLTLRYALAFSIEGWEGLGCDDGPLPVTPASVAMFCDRLPIAAEAVYRRLLFPMAELEAEKNGSAPAPSGTSAAGGSTAGSAPSSGSPAQGISGASPGNAPLGNGGKAANAALTVSTPRLH